MKDTVKNLLNKRKQENNKEEKLFIDSILDCNLMDEEEVSLMDLNFLFQIYLIVYEYLPLFGLTESK